MALFVDKVSIRCKAGDGGTGCHGVALAERTARVLNAANNVELGVAGAG